MPSSGRRAMSLTTISRLMTSPENVVLHLEGINLTATDLDTKGVAFEQFMDGFFKGDFGQYFTPRNIIAFTIQMLDIQVGDYVMIGLWFRRLPAAPWIMYANRPAVTTQTKTARSIDYWHSFAEKRLLALGSTRRSPGCQNEHDRSRRRSHQHHRQ